MPTPDLALVLKVRLILVYTGELSLLLPIWVGYRRWFVLEKHYRTVLWCCVMWAALTIVGEILFAAKQHNLFVWNTVTVLETLLLGYAFYLVLRSPKTRKLLRIAASGFIALAVADFFYFSGLHATTVYTVATESVLLITIVLLYFEQLLQELRKTPLSRNPMFLIGIGVIIYFSGTVMIFLLQDSVSGVQEMLMMMVNSVLSIVLNSIIAWALFLAGRPQLPAIRIAAPSAHVSQRTMRR